MNLIAAIFLWLALLAGIAAIPFGLPGTFVIAGAAFLYGLVTGFESITPGLVLALFAAAVILELLEAALTGYMAGRLGGSRTAFFGAIIGGIVGAIWGTAVLPLIGTLIGAFAGAFAGAFLGEYFVTRDTNRSLLAGIGAFIGAVGGKITKIFVSILMVITIGIYMFS